MIGKKKKNHISEDLSNFDDTMTGQDQNANDESGDSDSDQNIEETRSDLQAQRDEAVDRYQRTLADFRNYQRRSVQNEITAAERAKQDLIRELIPVLDNFDLAIEHAEEGAEESVEAMLKGIRMVRDILMQTLIQKGLQKVQPEQGDAFDPNYHEAIMMETTDKVQPNHVVRSVQAGYRMGDTGLRPAKVIIAKAITDDSQQEVDDDNSPEDNEQDTEA